MKWALPLLLFTVLAVQAQAPSKQLQELLKKYPDADANKDGVLTLEEARAYQAKMQKPRPTPDPNRIAPTLSGSYADDPACLFDFWKARSATGPAPLIIYIHGGGFKGGSKDSLAAGNIAYALDRGFALMTISYPFLNRKPIHEIMRDASRAVQYARSQAGAWNIDPQRIACMGSSAGAGTSLWIGSHPDLADPQAADPVARESTRVQAVGMLNGQATYDLLRWEELIGPAGEGMKVDMAEVMAFYHVGSEEALTQPAGVAARREADMMEWLDAGDPPLFVSCNTIPKSPLDRGSYLHHPRHSEAVATRARALGITVRDFIGPAAQGRNGTRDAMDFFAEQFGMPGKTP